ncbi:integral membrane [Fusarium sporotrichioides]|uniref:Integral membrane n=1 Tax=Fusarium sporotrichioides TaxID=5514 RepID=A0A395S2V7_FUSSP|nr:integral membrane [Fusarium sporotrichioides]
MHPGRVYSQTRSMYVQCRISPTFNQSLWTLLTWVLWIVTKNTTALACGAPIRNKSAEYMALGIAFSIPANLILILRILFKLYERNRFAPDDFMVIATLMSGASSSVINILLAKKGLGRDVWTITPDDITAFAKLFYIEQLLYFSTLNLLKLSMLFFYLRLFPSIVCPRAHKVILGTIIFTAILTCSFFVIGVFPCSPIDFFWKGWDKQHEGHCLDLQAVAWSFAIIGILLDLWMLGIPISQVRKLQLSPRKKAGVALMFLVGLVITVISLIRLKFVSQFHSDSQNPTWDYYEISKWSTVEITIGIILVGYQWKSILLLHVGHVPRIPRESVEEILLHKTGRI